MRVSSRVAVGIGLCCAVFAMLASAAVAGGGKRYADSTHKSYSVQLKATPRKVFWGTFIVSGDHFLKCDEGISGFAGGWTVKNVKIKNGRFHSVKQASLSDNLSYRLTLGGTVSQHVIHGTASIILYHSRTGPHDEFKCWSGKSKGKPGVPYVAKN